jgi:hypothetical protein
MPPRTSLNEAERPTDTHALHHSALPIRTAWVIPPSGAQASTALGITIRSYTPSLDLEAAKGLIQ